MRTLIVEDDFTSRKFLQSVLAEYGDCDIAVDGVEAVEAFKQALGKKAPYDLICLDIMMPNKDGHEALQEIRKIERQSGTTPPDEVKVIMTTALNDPKNVVKAYYQGGATSYLPKPIDKETLIKAVHSLGLID